MGRAEQPSSYFGEHRPGRLDGIGCDPMSDAISEPMREPMRDSTSDAMSDSASAAAKIAVGVATDAVASGNNHEAASHPADAPDHACAPTSTTDSNQHSSLSIKRAMKQPIPQSTNHIPLLDAVWAQAAVAYSSEELCVLAADTGRFKYLNPALARHLQFTADELAGKLFTEVACDLDLVQLKSLVETLSKSTDESQKTNHPARITITSSMLRRDGSGFPAELTFFLAEAAHSAPAVIVTSHDLSERQHTATTLALIEARFRAIVSNTPGLVYQFRRMPDGSIAFPYLSEACHALLDIDPERLASEPHLFVSQIVEEDRASYLASMEASAAEATTWNWEGRIRIAAWNDIKWINLRATPRLLSSGGMQWEGIMTNITQSKLEEAEIKRSRAQLAELSAHIERVKEQERTRIAREIHDDLGGNLTAIKMALALLKRRLPEDETLAEKADYVDSLVDRTIESIHRISVDLRPGILDFGIVAAIDWQAREFEKQAGIPCQVFANKKEIDLSTEQASALFRIFQESLTNISKHAKASRVTVKLTRSASAIQLEVSDNGGGIGARDQLKPKSFGIRGMIERADALGGKLTVTNAETGGSVVAISLPLSPALVSKNNDNSESP